MLSSTRCGYVLTERKIESSGVVAARIRGISRAPSRSRSAWSTWRAYCRSRTFWPSEPWMRPTGARSRIEDLPTALAASLGRPSTFTATAGMSANTSTTRTEPWANANTKAVCGTVMLRRSGLTWKRSDTSTKGSGRFGRRNVVVVSGVTSTARLFAWNRQNSSSSTKSPIASSIAATVRLSAS